MRYHPLKIKPSLHQRKPSSLRANNAFKHTLSLAQPPLRTLSPQMLPMPKSFFSLHNSLNRFARSLRLRLTSCLSPLFPRLSSSRKTMRSVIPRTTFLFLLFIFCYTVHFLITHTLPLPPNLSLSHGFQTASSESLTEKLQQWLEPTFAQSNLRLYVYDIPPEYNAHLVKHSIQHPGPIRDPRCDTNFYSSEYHLHHFLLHSPVRTLDPEQAHFFYVPIYTTCDLMKQPKGLDRVASNFQNAMHWVTTRFPYWNRTNGRDHVYLFAQGNSARLAGDWQTFSNGIFLVHNGEFTAPEYTPHKDFTIPPDLRHYLRPYWRDVHGTKKDPSKKYLAHFGGQVSFPSLPSRISSVRLSISCEFELVISVLSRMTSKFVTIQPLFQRIMYIS